MNSTMKILLSNYQQRLKISKKFTTKTWMQTTLPVLELTEMENGVRRYIAQCWPSTRRCYTSGTKGLEVDRV